MTVGAHRVRRLIEDAAVADFVARSASAKVLSVERSGLKIVRSQPPFDDAALDAFRQWQFQPGRDDRGAAVRTLVQQPIRFSLR